MVKRLMFVSVRGLMVFLFLVSFVPHLAQAQKASGKPILIGAHGDATKAASYYTLQQKGSTEAFVDILNATGGINGRPVEFLFENEENNPVLAVTKVEKLASQGVLFIISIGSSATGLAAEAKASELKIPIGAPTNVAEKLSFPVHKYYFRISLRDSVATQGVIAYLRKKYGNPKVAVVRDATETGLMLSDNFIKTLKEANMNVVATEQITPGTSDVTAQAMRVKEAKPDIVLLSGASIPDFANYVKTHKGVGNPAPMIGTYVFTAPAFLNLTGSASDGFIYTDAVDPGRPEVKAIEEKLVKYMGDRGRNNTTALQAWEFMRLLTDSIRRAGSDDREAIRNAMEQTNNWPIAVGPAGMKLSYSPSNHDLFNAGDQVILRELRGGTYGPTVPIR